MAGRWEGFLRGELKVRASGYNPERFFNLLKSGGIEVKALSCAGDSYVFEMRAEDFKRLKPYVRKSGVRVRILEKYGFAFWARRHRRRFFYPLGCLLFFLFIYSLSFFIWRIDFEGNEKFTDEYLTRYLAGIGVQAGMPARRVFCEQIEASIWEEFQDITWVSAQVSGTCLTVHVKENEVLLYVPEKDGTPRDLTAKKDGVITRMVVRNGVPLVKAGDQVSAGQPLVSGRIPITDDAEQVVAEHLTAADADIFARTETELSRTVSRRCPAESATGRRRYGFYFDVFGNRFAYLLPADGENVWKTVREEHQLRLTEDFYLPVHFGSVVSREYETYERIRSEQELKAMAAQWMAEEVEKLEEKGIQILANNVTIKVNDSECRMTLHLVTEEPIAEPAAITEVEKTGETDERN